MLRSYLPFLVLPVCYAGLFLWSKGFFRAAARRILKLFPGHDPAVNERVIQKAMLVLLLADLLGAAVTWQNAGEDTVSRGYLLREEYGSADKSEELELELDGERHEVELQIAARSLSSEEKQAALDRAEEVLPKLLFGEQTEQRAGQIEVRQDLSFPNRIPGEPVQVTWMQDSAQYLDFSGHITEEVPQEGAQVRLQALLLCEEESRELLFDILVMPQELTEEEQLDRELREAVGELNEKSEEKVLLPQEIGGRQANWSAKEDRTGISLLLLGILTAVVYIYSGVRLRLNAAEQREQKLKKDYPAVISKLVLLLGAGMSMRRAFARIAADYERGKNESKKPEERPGYEEIVRTVQEMERGVSEAEAYRNLGRRAGIAEYRTFSTVILQNLRKGGAEMLRILEREAAEAQENRKKQARIRGEEAGTKLMLPMLVMLVLVMAILTVPAFLTFL
ncbi:MAG: type II secretion system F family protein [Lachnospiraceae bacterium]|nr:type II secretion system F family protein [Lachnospiraceae bacterium]